LNYENTISIQSHKLCFSGCIQLVPKNLIKPKCKIKQAMPPVTANTVRHFYANHDISRIMPGIKDCISLNSAGKKVHP
jgi:hypothetical protein